MATTQEALDLVEGQATDTATLFKEILARLDALEGAAPVQAG